MPSHVRPCCVGPTSDDVKENNDMTELLVNAVAELDTSQIAQLPLEVNMSNATKKDTLHGKMLYDGKTNYLLPGEFMEEMMIMIFDDGFSLKPVENSLDISEISNFWSPFSCLEKTCPCALQKAS